jgi:aminopeptidase N
MLYARRRRGFNVTDLIASLEQESREPIGPFVRQWIKRPGVPGEFRSRYSPSAFRQQSLLEETTR